MFVVCTDRGQHKRTVLTTARRELDGGHGMNHALEWFAPPDASAEARTAMGHGGLFRTSTITVNRVDFQNIEKAGDTPRQIIGNGPSVR